MGEWASGRKILLAIGFALSPIHPLTLSSVWAQSPERVLNLDDSLRLALLNDAQFLSAEQDIKISEQRVREAKFLFYPDVGFGVAATDFHAERPFVLQPEFGSLFIQHNPGDTDHLYSGRAYLLQNLYSGGRSTNTYKLAQASLKAAKARYDAVKLDVTLNVKTVFYGTLAAQEKLHRIQARMEEIGKALGAGALSAWEKLEAESLSESLREQEALVRQQLDQSRLGYLKALNLELDTQVQLDGKLETRPVPVGLEKVSVWAIELRPELQSETYKAQMDAISVNLAFSRRLPSIFLGADYEYTGQDFPLRYNNWDATVGIRIPITYDFFTQLRQRRAEQRQGQIKRAELQDQVKLQVQQAYQDIEFWQDEWQRREKAQARAHDLYAAALKSSGPPLAVARALKGLNDIELKYLDAVQNHLLARAKLERAVGRSLE